MPLTLGLHDAPAGTGPALLQQAQHQCEPVLRTAVGLLVGPLATMAGYHLGWWDSRGQERNSKSGKSIHAALVFAAAAACGDSSNAAPAAAAVELMHNFSLVHDDVMDRDTVRRGQPTAWTIWGETNAILLGDVLHALAGRVLAELLDGGYAMHAVARLEAACSALCVGQLQDCGFETSPAGTVEQYLQMAAGKTAALMGCATALGALTAGADTATVSAMERFGYHLGLTFQIVDDVMGIWGDPAVTGKPVGNDLARRKSTLPVVTALNSGSESAEELAELYRSATPMTFADVARATELVEQAGGRDAAQRHADEQLLAAMTALPDPDRSADLIVLAHLVIDRDR